MSTKRNSQPKVVMGPGSYLDTKQQVWSIKLTGKLIDKVLLATQIDLMPENQDYGPVVNLLNNHRKLGEVLFECSREQAVDREISFEDFKDLFDGGVYLKGWEALQDAIHFFIQSLSPKRAEAFRAVIETAMKVLEAEVTTQIDIIQSQATDKALTNAVAGIKSRMQNDLVAEFANCSSKSPVH